MSKLKISTLWDIKELVPYLNRIGAEASSILRAKVKEKEGRYWLDLAVIKLVENNGQWSLEVQTSELENAAHFHPNKEEQAKIDTALTNIVLEFAKLQKLSPSAVFDNFSLHKVEPLVPGEVSKTCLLPEKLQKDRKKLLFYYDEKDQLEMLQHRVEGKDGEKNYYPWTYWDDNQWRCMEPPGPLPVWGLQFIGRRKHGNRKLRFHEIERHYTLFIHEGGKSASEVMMMLADYRLRNAHPFGEELAEGWHAGWIGGALNPKRTGWKELWAALKFKQVMIMRIVFVLDNDDPGKDALAPLSRTLAEAGIDVPMTAIRFTREFPLHFDLADDVPDDLFRIVKDADGKERRIYNGPSLQQLRVPATWATEQIGAKAFRLRQAFINECWWVHLDGTGELFFHEPTGRLYLPAMFAADTRSLAHKKAGSIAELFKNDARALKRKVDGICCLPGMPMGEVIHPKTKVRCVNVFRPGSYMAVPGAKVKHWRPWIEFLEYFIPDPKEREYLADWLATLVLHPEIRMGVCVLLVSNTQGTGKSTFAEIAAHLVGLHNRSVVTTTMFLAEFNDWLFNKWLITIAEVKAEERNFKFYDKLKELVTDEFVAIRRMYMPPFSADNISNYILLSNEVVPLRITQSERRIFMPRVTELTKEYEWWAGFRHWLFNGGLPLIMSWAVDRLKTRAALQPLKAPDETERKNELKQAARSPAEDMVRMLAQAMFVVADGTQIVTLENWVQDWVRKATNTALSFANIRLWMTDEGLFKTDKALTADKAFQFALTTVPTDNEGWKVLKDHAQRPDDIMARLAAAEPVPEGTNREVIMKTIADVMKRLAEIEKNRSF